MACDELFTNEEEEYSLYEAVKFLMLNRAIELYDDKEKGREVPFFSVLLFARDTSSDPGQLLRNHLNQVGHTGGLEQVSRAFGSTLTQSSSISLQLLPQFCGSGAQEPCRCVVLAQGRRRLQLSLAQGCSLRRARLQLEGPLAAWCTLTWLLAGGLSPSLGVSGRAQCLTMWGFP